jgi:hypothetical protein
MATFEKRGQYWRAKIRRKGYPEQTQSLDLKSKAEAWARSIENEMDKGTFVDRTETEKNTLGDLIDRYLKEVTPLKRGKGPELQGRARLQLCQQLVQGLEVAHARPLDVCRGRPRLVSVVASEGMSVPFDFDESTRALIHFS